MKFFKKTTLIALTLAGTTLGMVGCKSNVKVPVTFVAATSDTYNAEVTFGDYDYKFKGKVDQKSDNFTLEGIVQQRHIASSGGGQQGGFPGGGGGFGPGGGGGGGGGQPQPAKPNPTSISLNVEKNQLYINEVIKATVTAEPADADTSVTWSSSNEEVLTVKDGSITPLAEGTATVKAESSKAQGVSASINITVVKEDLAAHNWSLTGKWRMDEGYGYVLTLDDERKTEIHADFDKVQGRHQFYYTVEIEKTKSTVLFQAKDPTFKNSLAKDYKSWDERDSKHIYYARATGNNGSAATAFLYLHSDGSAVLNAPSGANRAYTFGLTWEEDANKIVTLHSGELAFKSKNSVNAEHPGSLLAYSSYTFIRSDNPDVKWKKMVLSDFEGATEHEFVGSYTVQGPDGGTKEVNLNFYSGGVAKLYNGSWTASDEGTWAKVGDSYTLTLGGKDYPVVQEGDKLVVTYKIEVQSIFGKSTQEVKLTQTK